MSAKKKKKMRGAIAVFLSLIMLGMTVFECVLIDESRIIAAKSVVSGSGDLALNSALTNYDQVLYEVYGLFATSSEADLEKNIEDYFNRTIQGAGIDGSLDDINNMLSLMLEDDSLELINVEGSSLANQDVLEQQILEYMKFRGPVNIGFGLLEKVGAFKDFNKQTEAVEAQLDFEEKLDSLQSACQNVYDKANALKTESEMIGLHSYFLDVSYIQDRLGTFQKLVVPLAYLMKDSQLNDCNITDVPEGFSDVTWTDSDYANKYDIALLHDIVALMKSDTAAVTRSESREYVELYKKLKEYKEQIVAFRGSPAPDLEQYGQSLRGYMDLVLNDSNRMKVLYLLLSRYEVWWNRVGIDSGDEEQQEFYSDNWSYIRNKVIEIDDMDLDSLFYPARDDFEGKIIQIYEEAHTKLSERKEYATTQKNQAEALRKSIDCGSHTSNTENFCCLKSAIEKIQSAKNTWEGKIENLPAGNTKTSMQGTFESEAEGIDLSKCDVLLSSVKDIEDYLNRYLEYIKGYTFSYNSGQTIISDTSINSNSNAWVNFLVDVKNTVPNGYGTYSCITYDSAYPSLPAALSYPNEIHHVIENDEFYQFLVKICGEAKQNEDTNKKEAEEIKDSLMDKGNNTNDKEIGSLTQGTVNWDEVNTFTTEKALEDPNDTSVGKSSNNKQVSKNAKASMKNTSSFLKGIENILVKGRNDIYLAEYAVGMFSCYTTGIKDGKQLTEPVYTIAGTDEIHKLNTTNNVLFRSEQEYILWGNHNQKKNVNNTLLCIFGIRFALNTIYAFVSDAEINAVTLAWATAIAGWTGFGVPIVQSVLKVALALAESTYDIYLLKKGYDVPFYKTNNTWVMKPSGMSKAFIEKASETVANYASDKVDQVFNYVDNVTTETVDKVTEKLANTVEEAQETIVNSAVSTIVSPFEKLMVTASAQVNLSDDQIRAKVNAVYDSIYAKASADDSNLGQLEVYVLQQCKSTIVDTMSSKIIELKNSATKKAESLLNSQVEELKETLKSCAKASDIVKRLGDEVNASVSQAIQDVNQQVQEDVSEAVSQSVSNFLTKVQGANSGESSVTSGFAITINYQEYVHIFLMLKTLTTNNEQYLNRVGQLIQINMRNKNASFALNNCYTMLQLNATVKIKTTFIGKLDSFLENPVGGQTEYKLKYKGLQGY